MTKIETLKARLAEATAAVERFENDTAFMARRSALEIAEEEAERASGEASERHTKAEREAGIRLGFYVRGWKLRKSYLDVIAEKIGITYKNRETLSRGNRYHDDPFEHAARKYAQAEIAKDAKVIAAYEAWKPLQIKHVKAQDACREFLHAYTRARYDKRSAEGDLQEAVRVDEERKDKMALAAGGRDAASAKKYREQQAKCREARKLLEEIADGNVKLDVPR